MKRKRSCIESDFSKQSVVKHLPSSIIEIAKKYLFTNIESMAIIQYRKSVSQPTKVIKYNATYQSMIQ